MAQSGDSQVREQYSRSVGCPTSNFVMVVCKNKDKKYLSLNDDIPSFSLNHSDKYAQFGNELGSITSIMKQKCGVDIIICGILRIEHTENNGQFATMRCIYYAETVDGDGKLNKNTKWIDIPKKDDENNKVNNDLYSWINYLEFENGIIYPMNVFTFEGQDVKMPNYKMENIKNHNANFLNIISNDNNKKQNDEEKQQ